MNLMVSIFCVPPSHSGAQKPEAVAQEEAVSRNKILSAKQAACDFLGK